MLIKCFHIYDPFDPCNNSISHVIIFFILQMGKLKLGSSKVVCTKSDNQIINDSAGLEVWFKCVQTSVLPKKK
jgi:hypothetical protein